MASTFHLFGPLEREIMVILWREGHGTVRSVWQQIAPSRGIAYTTVMTSTTRLAEKGILATHILGPIHGPRGYQYWPLLTRSDLMQQAVHQMWDELGATDVEQRELAEALHG